MTRADAERKRALHELELLLATCQGVELVLLDAHEPPGFEVAQALTGTAVKLALTLARLDAYMRAEK